MNVSWRRPFSALGPLLLALGLAGCHGADDVRFPLRQPVWQDPDMRAFSAPCRKDEDGETVCMPEPYVSPLGWDAADNTIFLPTSRFFAVAPGGESVNVNSVDEVPNSSWFVNRVGVGALSREQILSGACDPKQALNVDDPDGSWLVDQGKPNGATPGFRVKVPGRGKFMLKADVVKNAERASAASVIGSRLYYAAGFHTPCEQIIYVRPSIFKMKPGLKSTDNSGVTKPFDEAALERVLSAAPWKDGLVRLEASQWLPNPTLGPFKYEGTRDDDPNDVIDHDDRRELRGSRLLAAWINHFDAREQNTMTTWIAAAGAEKTGSPGYIRHYYLDFSDSFGSEWDWDLISRRLGHSYYLDFGDVLGDFATLGLIERPWDRAARSAEAPIFGYFGVRDFDPEEWKAGYPNPAFGRMTERDGAWMARVLAKIEPQHVRELVKLGQFTNPAYAHYLERVLIERQRRILARYFSRLSPIGDVRALGRRVCGIDLAAWTGVVAASSLRYSATIEAGDSDPVPARIELRGGSEVCAVVDPASGLDALPKDHEQRYRIVRISNGSGSGPLEAHVYDLGDQGGLFLAGVLRPD